LFVQLISEKYSNDPSANWEIQKAVEDQLKRMNETHTKQRARVTLFGDAISSKLPQNVQKNHHIHNNNISDDTSSVGSFNDISSSISHNNGRNSLSSTTSNKRRGRKSTNPFTNLSLDGTTSSSAPSHSWIDNETNNNSSIQDIKELMISLHSRIDSIENTISSSSNNKRNDNQISSTKAKNKKKMMNSSSSSSTQRSLNREESRRIILNHISQPTSNQKDNEGNDHDEEEEEEELMVLENMEEEEIVVDSDSSSDDGNEHNIHGSTIPSYFDMI